MILDKKTSEKYMKEIRQDLAVRAVDAFIRENLVEDGIPLLYLDKIVDCPRDGLADAVCDALSNDSPVRDDDGEYMSWEQVILNPMAYVLPEKNLIRNYDEIKVALLDMSDSELMREEAYFFAKFFYPMFDFSQWGRRNIVILAIGILDNCLALGEDGQVYFDRINIYESVDRAFRDYGYKYKEYDEPLVVSII